MKKMTLDELKNYLNNIIKKTTIYEGIKLELSSDSEERFIWVTDVFSGLTKFNSLNDTLKENILILRLDKNNKIVNVYDSNFRVNHEYTEELSNEVSKLRDVEITELDK